MSTENLPAATPSKKNDVPIPSSCQLPLMSQLELGPGDHLFYLFRDLGKVDLVWVPVTNMRPQVQ